MSQENVEVVRRHIYESIRRRPEALCPVLLLTPELVVAFRKAAHRGPIAVVAGRRPSRERMLVDVRRRASSGEDFTGAGVQSCSKTALNEGGRRGSKSMRAALSSSRSAEGKLSRIRFPRARRSPRSRRTVGVGDVAGERGDRPRAARAFNRGDLDEMLRSYLRPGASSGTSAIVGGQAEKEMSISATRGFRRWYADLFESFESLPERDGSEFRDLGDRRSRLRHGFEAAGGAKVGSRSTPQWAWVFHGKARRRAIKSTRASLSRDEALDAAGLRE